MYGRVDGPDHAYITDEDELTKAGGVTADDRVEVLPYLKKQKRFSFVRSDPKATELDCFKKAAKARRAQ